MADTFSSGLRVRLQQTGGNENTWGQNLNAAGLQLLEDAIRGLVAITVTTSDITLTAQNGATDQARMAILQLTGAPGAERSIIVPDLAKHYIVLNETDAAQTVRTSAGTGVSVPVGARQFLLCNGTEVYAVQASALGTVANADKVDGLDAAAFAQLALFNTFTKGFATEFQTLTDGGTVTLDASLGNKFYLEIGGNRTLSITNPTDGQEIELWVRQDGTGGRTLTFPGTVQFETGSSSSLSAAAAALDRFDLTYNQAQGAYIARSALNSSASAVNLTVTGTQVNLNVFELAGSPGVGVTVNLTTDTGTRVYSHTPAVPAIDFDGFASGTIINWTNNGKVMGCGGRGGKGGSTWREGAADAAWRGEPGEAGGNAVRGPGAGVTFNITNANGFIWGGGGGGGGGGVSSDDGTSLASAGGGGGGAGAGQSGSGSQFVDIEGNSVTAGTRGTNGTYDTTSANGTAGTGAETGSAVGGDGGAGGDWGTAGSAGEAPTTFTRDIASGSGGAAGLAVDQNGGTASFVSGSGSPNVKGAVT